MKAKATAVIDYHYETEINDNQTLIYFRDEWYEILTDQEGEFYFMYEGKSIYFEVAAKKD